MEFDIDKGIIFSVEDVKEAITAEEFADAILIEKFNLEFIGEVMEAISKPVIASCRRGHFIEAKILEKMGISAIDESIDSSIGYINKKDFSTPFICMVESNKEANKRIDEGAKFVRTPWGDIGDIMGIINEIKDNVIASLKIASPSDIAMLFQSGVKAIIISPHVFRSPNPPKLLKALQEASTYYNDIEKIFQISKKLGNIIPKI